MNKHVTRERGWLERRKQVSRKRADDKVTQSCARRVTQSAPASHLGPGGVQSLPWRTANAAGCPFLVTAVCTYLS